MTREVGTLTLAAALAGLLGGCTVGEGRPFPTGASVGGSVGESESVGDGVGESVGDGVGDSVGDSLGDSAGGGVSVSVGDSESGTTSSSDAGSSSGGSVDDATTGSPTGDPLDPDLDIPDGGEPCTTPGSLTECPGIAVCRFATTEQGLCESCDDCGNLNAPCSEGTDCDILFSCYAGHCTNFCTLGTFECGPVEACLDIGHPTMGVCDPFA